ncbi:MAG: hypothetical protein H7246_06505 [Phycisphaerae bacterium]|nr:hypothetical protein [Saprospiraceae bacterium]
MNGVFDGIGKRIFANGDKYEGNFLKGEFAGAGTFETSAYIYKGEFKDGLFEGTGTLTYKNGDLYNGSFKEGQMSGSGTYKYGNGDYYSGEISGGLLNGDGVMFLSKFGFYSGQFSNGILNGRGKIEYGDGRNIEGNFELGMPTTAIRFSSGTQEVSLDDLFGNVLAVNRPQEEKYYYIVAIIFLFLSLVFVATVWIRNRRNYTKKMKQKV